MVNSCQFVQFVKFVFKIKRDTLSDVPQFASNQGRNLGMTCGTSAATYLFAYWKAVVEPYSSSSPLPLLPPPPPLEPPPLGVSGSSATMSVGTYFTF